MMTETVFQDEICVCNAFRKNTSSQNSQLDGNIFLVYMRPTVSPKAI